MQNLRLLTFLCLIITAGLPGSTAAQAQYRFQWQLGGYDATGLLQFVQPKDVAIDREGNIYVVGTNNHRIKKFNAGGNLLLKFGTEGHNDGQLYYPQGIAIDAQGNIYVSGGQRIQKFNSSGQFLSKFGTRGQADGQFEGTGDITIDDSGNLFVTDHGNHRIQKFDSSGRFLMKFGSEGIGNGQFQDPSGVALDSQGNIFVVELNGHRVQKFDQNGRFISKFATEGRAESQFQNPSRIALDEYNKIYIADEWNHRIQKFDANGQFILKFGTLGSAEGQFSYPSGIVVDKGGNLFIADQLNNRIQKFSPLACPGIVLSPAALPDATVGVTYTAAVTGAPAGYTYSAAGLPAGLSISSTGVISGIPTTAHVAPVNVMVTARYEHCSQSIAYSLFISQGAAIVSLSNLLQTYSGTARPVRVNTTPADLGVSLTYNGSATLPVNPGNYTVEATVTSLDYTGSATSVLTVSKAPLTVRADNLSRGYGSENPAFSLSYSGLVNGETVSVIDNLPNVTTPATQTSVTGNYPITLAGGSDNNYALTLENGTLTVTKISQSISFAALPVKKFGDAPFTLPANATSGLGVSFTSSNPEIASIDENTVTILTAGTVTITASQDGNENFSPAASDSQTLQITKLNQTIAFDPPDDKMETDATFNLSATASSGLPVSFRVVSGPAAILGSFLTSTGAGLVTIEATQDGNENYNPASSVSRHLCVNPVQPVIIAHGVTLHSSSRSGNQWYLDGEALTGETRHILVVRTEGNYSVAVTASCGQTKFSNIFSVNSNPIPDAGTVYPNPAVDRVALELPEGVTASGARIVDANGHEVASTHEKNNTSILFNITMLKKGIYYIEAQTNKGVIRHRFLIR